MEDNIDESKYIAPMANNILYVIKLMTYEKEWCRHITYNYDISMPEQSTIGIYIGPIEYQANIIRNEEKLSQSDNFVMPAYTDTELLRPNNFFIFIDDKGCHGICFMIQKKKIYEYRNTHPKINSDYFLIDKEFIKKNCIWISKYPSEDDKKIVYPGHFERI